VSLFRPVLKPDSVIEVAGHPVRLRVNARAKRISLRIDAKARQVVATSPTPRGLHDALKFAESRADWIADRLARVPDARPLRPGLILSVGGEPCRLERAAMRIAPRLIPATAAEPMRLVASGDGEAYGRAALRALKAEALARVSDRTAHYAARLNQPIPTVAVGDPKGRWGSCKPAARGRSAVIRYSWRLVLAPAWVLDYVAAHEVAHLLEANHGPQFWAIVHRLYGDPAKTRRWLAAHGAELQAVTA